MKKAFIGIVALLALLCACGASQSSEELSSVEENSQAAKPQEETKFSLTILNEVTESGSPIDIVLAQQEPLLSAEILTQVSERVAQNGWGPVRFSLLSGYTLLSEEVLKELSNELGKEWDVLYFAEPAFGGEAFDDLFLELSDALSQGILEPVYAMLPENVWEAMRIQGGIYNLAQAPGIVASGIRVAEPFWETLGVPAEAVQNIEKAEDLEPYWEQMYAAGGGLPFWGLRQFSITRSAVSGRIAGRLLGGFGIDGRYQLLGSVIGIHSDTGVAENILESEVFKKELAFQKECYEQGYAEVTFRIIEERTGLSPSEQYALPLQDVNNQSYLQLQAVYSDSTYITAPQNEYQLPYRSIPFQSTARIMTQTPQPFTVIAKQTPQPEAVLELMCFLLTDAQTNALLSFGTNEPGQFLAWDGLITTPILAQDTAWCQEKWPHGEEDLYRVMQQAYERVPLGAAVGFVWDPSAVAGEIEAVRTKLEGLSRYDWALRLDKEEFPNIRLEENYADILTDLHEAGIDVILKDIQQAWEAWKKGEDQA